MKKEPISVIVPIYNSEKYLDRCLDSIIAQTYEDLEIILINDGSTDGTLKIIENYEKNDQRIRIFSQTNKGLSAARNLGLDNCNGSYIVFVDSDDEIRIDMIEKLYDLLIKNDCDIAVCSVDIVKDGGSTSENTQGGIHIYEDDHKYDQILDDDLRTVVQWNKLYKRYIFDDLRYPEGYYHEDEFVIHKQLFKANKIIYTDEKLYIYHLHEQSITSSLSMQKRYHASLAIYDRVNFFKDIDKPELSRKHYFWLINYINMTLILRNRYDDAHIYTDKLKELKRKAITENKYPLFERAYCTVAYFTVYIFKAIRDRL